MVNGASDGIGTLLELEESFLISPVNYTAQVTGFDSTSHTVKTRATALCLLCCGRCSKTVSASSPVGQQQATEDSKVAAATGLLQQICGHSEFDHHALLVKMSHTMTTFPAA